VRNSKEAGVLRDQGDRIQVFQLQGNLVFSTAEVVMHDVTSAHDQLDMVIIDFKHVITIDESASRLFYHMLIKLQEQAKKVVFTNLSRVPGLRRFMKLKLKEQFESQFTTFEDNDSALEWCENRLLAQTLAVPSYEDVLEREDYELFAQLEPDEVAIIRALLHRRSFQRGEVIVECGAPAGAMYFLVSGCASATMNQGSGTKKRLGTFSPGMTFGEMALLDRSPRSAEVTADVEVECDLLKLEDFELLSESHPHIKLVLLRNLALGLSRNLRKRNQEFSVFDY